MQMKSDHLLYISSLYLHLSFTRLSYTSAFQNVSICNEKMQMNECLFVFVSFFFLIEHLLTHTETSPLPVKGCKFKPMHDNKGTSAVGVFFSSCHTCCDTGNPLMIDMSENP